jgi:hypothetical protein
MKTFVPYTAQWSGSATVSARAGNVFFHGERKFCDLEVLQMIDSG